MVLEHLEVLEVHVQQGQVLHPHVKVLQVGQHPAGAVGEAREALRGRVGRARARGRAGAARAAGQQQAGALLRAREARGRVGGALEAARGWLRSGVDGVQQLGGVGQAVPAAPVAVRGAAVVGASIIPERL